MQDYLEARDACEAHVLAAVDALAIVLGLGAGGLTAETRAERTAHLAEAARAIAAAQAADDAARPAAPEPGAVERALRRLAGD